MTLDCIKSGGWAFIAGISQDAPQRRRLLELGLTRGALVRMCGHAAFGDPVWIYVRGGYLTMRKSQAAAILVRPALPLPGGGFAHETHLWQEAQG